MAEFSFPFDAGAGAAVAETEWQSMMRALIPSCVLRGRAGELAVTTGGGMSVNVASGAAWVHGHFYVNDATKNLLLAVAHATLARKDAVVLRLDRTANSVTALVLTGTPGAGVAPTLSATDLLFDLPLATVDVPAAAGVPSVFTDRRVRYLAGDHGDLTGLGDDDHAQYLNNARGDARYLALGAKAADSNLLDGQDSTAFAPAHAHPYAASGHGHDYLPNSGGTVGPLTVDGNLTLTGGVEVVVIPGNTVSAPGGGPVLGLNVVIDNVTYTIPLH